MTVLQQQFESCIVAGAIGDAWGSAYENQHLPDMATTFYLGGVKEPVKQWAFTDDTQLTLATCESLFNGGGFDPPKLARCFVQYYKAKRLTGLGASTLQALVALEAGAHWSQAGRLGEYGAGNGAAMRIAPFAFFDNITRAQIRSACFITHRNDEAYVGALAIWLSIRAAITGAWTGENNLFNLLIPELPDTRVRDRLIEINAMQHKAAIKAIAQLGNNGYVVNSVPLAIFAATQAGKIGMYKMYEHVIHAGGDTDTNASLAGQLAGALLGMKEIPASLLLKLRTVYQYDWVMERIHTFSQRIG